MNTIARVGVDLAKHLLQVHAVDSAGNVITNRVLARGKFVEWCVHLPLAALSRWRQVRALTSVAAS
jgi:hypothetical protein